MNIYAVRLRLKEKIGFFYQKIQLLDTCNHVKSHEF
jgi:hypothetical protein